MLTPEEKAEIEALKKDPLVKLATRSLQKTQDPEKKRLYQLRWLKKKGKQIMDSLEAEIEDDNEGGE